MSREAVAVETFCRLVFRRYLEELSFALRPQELTPQAIGHEKTTKLSKHYFFLAQAREMFVRQALHRGVARHPNVAYICKERSWYTPNFFRHGISRTAAWEWHYRFVRFPRL